MALGGLTFHLESIMYHKDCICSYGVVVHSMLQTNTMKYSISSTTGIVCSSCDVPSRAR
jgi:hypothetical protein